MSFRLTYATMFNPPEEMHERFESRWLSTLAAGCEHPAVHRWGRRGGRGDGVATEPDRPGHASRGFRDRYGGARGRERCGQRRRVPGLARTPFTERVRHGAPGRRHHGAARLRHRGGADSSRSARTAWRPSAKRRKRWISSAGTPTTSRRRGYENRVAERSAAGDCVAQPQRDAPVWRVGGDRAVQFPAGAGGRPGRSSAGHRQTVVAKGASDTPWAGRLLADCIRDAGLPPASSIAWRFPARSRRALSAHPDTAGLTFTGSVGVGMNAGR